MTVLNTADALKVGGSAVDRVYSGSSLIWEAGGGGGASFQDDFSGGSLGAGWVRRGVVAGDETWGANLTVSLAHGEGYYRELPDGIGSDFIVEAQIDLGNHGVMSGPWILNDSGFGVGATLYNNPSGLLVTSISSYDYGSSFQSLGVLLVDPVRFRLTKSGTSYTAAYSTDGGGSWTSETPALTWAGPPTRVGFGSWFSGQTITISDFLVQ